MCIKKRVGAEFSDSDSTGNIRGKTLKSHNHRSRGDTPHKAQTIQFSNA